MTASWKVSQRENIRARHVCSDTDPDLVLAPSDFWKVNFQARLEALLKDNDKFPGNTYTCDHRYIHRAMPSAWPKETVQLPGDRLEDGGQPHGRPQRKITLSVEFIYKEVTGDPSTVKGRKRSRALLRLKGFREPPSLVFGPESTSIIVAGANTASKGPTAGRTNEEITINCC